MFDDIGLPPMKDSTGIINAPDRANFFALYNELDSKPKETWHFWVTVKFQPANKFSFGPALHGAMCDGLTSVNLTKNPDDVNCLKCIKDLTNNPEIIIKMAIECDEEAAYWGRRYSDCQSNEYSRKQKSFNKFGDILRAILNQFDYDSLIMYTQDEVDKIIKSSERYIRYKEQNDK